MRLGSIVVNDCDSIGEELRRRQASCGQCQPLCVSWWGLCHFCEMQSHSQTGIENDNYLVRRRCWKNYTSGYCCHRRGLLYPFLLIFKTFVTKPGKVRKINSYFAADDIGHQLYSIAFSQIWCMCSYPAMLGFFRRTVKRSEIPGRSQRAVRNLLQNWSFYF